MPRPPPLSCDCHIHVFGPFERYPLDAARKYTPDEATLRDYLKVASALGLGRVVFVQPSVYGVDNSCQLDALRALEEHARGVAVVDDSVSDENLEKLCGSGFVGARLNLTRAANLDSLERLAARVKDLRWHLQLHLPGSVLPEIAGRLLALPVDFVIDHFGRVDAHEGLEQPAFQALLHLLESGKGWVKLSAPYRIDLDGPPYRKAAPFARELAQRFPERLVWGTDWPHPDVAVVPEDKDLLDALFECVPDEAVRHRILVDNPAKLYRF
jgi:predicted TIM-barrel fold metal-dependent hydrolase